jgi:hypothetical protein
MSKITASVERNYKDIEIKDLAILFWSYGRIEYQNFRLKDVLRARYYGFINLIKEDQNGLYYVADESPLLSEIEDNIIAQDFP